MRIVIKENAQILGKAAAQAAAQLLREAIAQNGSARLLVSTGASQFTMFEALIQEDLDWSKVEMFHLDEYVGMAETHPASFVGYLKARFTSKVSLAAAHFIDGTADSATVIAQMTEIIRQRPIDVGLIGIGENAHIAFNDPPADFNTMEAFRIVQLDEACRKQQLGEGWFPSLEAVPTHAISMTVYQILQCKKILSVVPYAVKAQAVLSTLSATGLTPEVPATALRSHRDVTLYLDEESAGKLPVELRG